MNKFLVCETTYQEHTAEEEFVTCHQLELEKCIKESGCPTVPKTECAVQKRNVTQEFPETEVSCECLIALKNNLSTICNTIQLCTNSGRRLMGSRTMRWDQLVNGIEFILIKSPKLLFHM